MKIAKQRIAICHDGLGLKSLMAERSKVGRFIRPVMGLLLTAQMFMASPSGAADVAFSGYGTVGYAISDRPYTYQRYIDDKGTFTRDSVLGVQMDVSIEPKWSATAQLKLAPSDSSDNRWKPIVSWAFMSWRPTNDWLFRLGKMRIPGYLNAENMDVGTTFDYARLPIELYSISPTYDYTGISFNKTFDIESGSLVVLDGYWGRANTDWRIYFRDGIPGILPSGPNFVPVKAEPMGLALAYHKDDDVYRIGLHRLSAKREDGQDWQSTPVLVSLAPGISYYDFQAGTGSTGAEALDMSIVNLGADIGLGNNVRLAGEYLRNSIRGVGSSNGGYISLRKRIGQWTPYVVYSKMRSDDKALALYQAVNSSSVPAFVPGAATINAAQLAVADNTQVYDQYSWAIGASCMLSQTSKIKAEWARTHIGVKSSLVDAPSGSSVSDQSVNVFSLSYSFTF